MNVVSCLRMLRFVALSSTISTLAAARLAAVSLAVAAGARCFSKSAVNQKVEPWPGVLSTPIWPPISSTSCLEIASPNPVPPYLRVVEPSA